MANEDLTDRVRQMKAQGMQNSQRIDVMQHEGRSSNEIFDAISHANIPSGGPQTGAAPSQGSGFPPPAGFPATAPAAPPSFAPPAAPAPRMDPLMEAEKATRGEAPQSFQPSHHARHATPEVSTEEYIEAIIDEKWVELEDDIQKVVEWKNRSEQRLAQLQKEMDDLKDRFDKLHTALIGKIESYDKNILEVGAEIRAMEKVFSKVLPVFTDNVKQLDEIADKMKRSVR